MLDKCCKWSREWGAQDHENVIIVLFSAPFEAARSERQRDTIAYLDYNLNELYGKTLRYLLLSLGG
jgi:hypothetical protein